MNFYIESKSDQKAAKKLRTYFGKLTDIQSPEQMVLFPGIGMALFLVLYWYGVRNCIIGKNEYLANLLRRFGASELETEDLVESVLKQRPEAVILSLVSFLGSVIPVAHIFREIRKRCGRKCPLLIADCAHAGAISFPSLKGLSADIICLDTGKWIMEEKFWLNGPVLLWFSDHYYRTARDIFSPFALAILNPDQSIIGRDLVISVNTLHRIVAILPDQRILRKKLRNNLIMAQELAKVLGLPMAESSLLSVKGEKVYSELVSKLDQQGLVWRIAESGIARIKCCSDIYLP